VRELGRGQHDLEHGRPDHGRNGSYHYGPGAHDDRHNSDCGPGHYVDVEPERR
jgi:hypothetical protein